MGKTSFALQVALHQASKGRPTTFVSLEMTGRELASRHIVTRTGIETRRLRSGELQLLDLQEIDQVASDAAKLAMRIWSPHQATVAQIRGVAKRDAATAGLSLLVVDYIGLVRPTDPRRPRHEQVSMVSAALKSVAKELQIPVLALCQLNRESDKTKRAEPKLSHLRESGSIEQDADIVLLLHRRDNHDGQTKLIIAKHRHADTGALMLTWDAVRTSFH
jgi:replicative DNA helicase